MFDRLWDALEQPSTRPEDAMKIVNTADCGLGQRSTRSYCNLSVNYRNHPTIKRGSTPLMLAVLANRPDVAAKFLAAGAKVDAKERKGRRTALHVAVAIGSSVCINVLSDYGADINSVDKIGVSPMHKAVEYQDIPCLMALLAEGADVRAAYPRHSFYGKHWAMFTPLHEAALLCARDDDQMVATLIKNGADPNFAVGKLGFTPIHLAAELGRAMCLRLLLTAKGAKSDEKANNGLTPMHLATQNGHAACLKMLLKKTSNENISHMLGQKAFRLAAENGHTECLAMLIAAGFVPKHNLASALNAASRNGHDACVKWLLERGADPNAATKSGWTPLHSAAGNGHVACVDALTSKGADARSKLPNGDTPLLFPRWAKMHIPNKSGWLGHFCYVTGQLIDIILSLALWGTLSCNYSTVHPIMVGQNLASPTM